MSEFFILNWVSQIHNFSALCRLHLYNEVPYEMVMGLVVVVGQGWGQVLFAVLESSASNFLIYKYKYSKYLIGIKYITFLVKYKYIDNKQWHIQFRFKTAFTNIQGCIQDNQSF